MTNLSKNAKTDVLVHVVGGEEASKRKVVQQLQEPEHSKKSHPFWTGKLLDDDKGLNFRQLLLLTGLSVGAVCLSTIEHKPSCVHIEGNNNTVVVEGVSAPSCVSPSRVKP